MMGSQRKVQKAKASRQPMRSPSSHTQQLERVVQLPQYAYCTDRVRVIAGLMRQPALGANDRAMWQKMAMLKYPESQLSMKVVLGLERRRVKSTRMKTPIDSLARMRKMPPSRVSSSIFWWPKISLMAIAAIAPNSWAGRQQSIILGLYLLSFLRQLESVMTGLMLAPLRLPHIPIETRSKPAACISFPTQVIAHRYPKVNRKTARHSNTKICKRGASFIMLNLSCSNLLSVLSLRLFDSLNSFQSSESSRVRLIWDIRVRYKQIIKVSRQYQYHFSWSLMRCSSDQRYCFSRDRRVKRVRVLSACLEWVAGGIVHGELDILV